MRPARPSSLPRRERSSTKAAAPPKAAPEPKPDRVPRANAAPPAPGAGKLRPNPPRPLWARRSPANGSRRRRSRAGLAEAQGIDLATLKGSGPGGRIVRADLGSAAGGVAAAPAAAAQPQAAPVEPGDIPHEAVKLSNMRKTIARRLTESKQQIPHIYLTVDIQLDALLKLRGDLNAGLATRNIKLSVNDLLIKALARR